MRLCGILSPGGTKPAKNFAFFSRSVRRTTRHHTKHNDKKFILPHTKTLTRTQIQKQTKFLQINAPNTPRNRTESHNHNCHKNPKIATNRKKHTKRPALPQSQQPLKRRKPAEIRHFYPSQPQINSKTRTYTPTHHIPQTPWNFKKRPNLHPLIIALCLHTPTLDLSYCKHSVFLGLFIGTIVVQRLIYIRHFATLIMPIGV